MTARIEGFVTRDEAGLRRPRSFSSNITPQGGGCVVHWGGPAQRLGAHSRCLRLWRGWQRFHMDTHKWADIAYTGGFCNHGFAFAGRGFGVRTAANGTNTANQHWYAFVWIGGQGDDHPTQAAVDAVEWWIAQARTAGGAGQKVAPHGRFTGSACPGPQLQSLAGKLDMARIEDAPEDAPEETVMLLVRKQGDTRVYHVIGDRLVHVPNKDTMQAILEALEKPASAAIKDLPADHPIFSLPIEER